MAVPPSGPKRPARSRPARLLLAVVVLVLLARYVVLPLIAWRRAESCERPSYEALGSLAGETIHGSPLKVELRRYEPHLVAEVRVPKGLPEEEQRSLGFGQVASYIFGDNQRRRPGFLGRRLAITEGEPEPIAMTAPVQTELHPAVQKSASEEHAETSVVSFTMPSKYKAIHELPIPQNSNVTLRVVPGYYAAAVGMRGATPKSAKVSEVQGAIRRAVAGAGLKVDESTGVLLLQYHDPFATPSMLRWNEVALRLQEDGVEKAMAVAGGTEN